MIDSIIIDNVAYNVVNDGLFFNSINAWIEDDKTETTLKIVEDNFGNMVMTDISYEDNNPIVFGNKGAVVLFEAMDEINDVISKYVSKPNLVEIYNTNRCH